MSNLQKDWMNEILNLLKESQIGLSIKNIAEQLGCSRTTVSKYLEQLENDGEVFDRRLGQYRIWLHKDAKLYYDKEKAKGQKFALKTYTYFLRYLKEHHPNLDSEGKKIGKYISKNINLEELISVDLLQFDLATAELQDLAGYIMDILDNTYLSMDSYEWDPPVVIEEPPMIILRIKGSQFISTPLNFHMLAGLMEDKINIYLRNSPVEIKVDVQTINEEANIVDLRININYNN